MSAWSLRDIPYGDDMLYPDVGLVATIPTLEPGPRPAGDLFSGSALYWVLGAGLLVLLLALASKKGRR